MVEERRGGGFEEKDGRGRGEGGMGGGEEREFVFNLHDRNNLKN